MNHNFEDHGYLNEFNQLDSSKWNYYSNAQKIDLLQHIGDKYSESRGLSYSPEIFPEGRADMLGGFDGRRIFINLGSCQNPYEALYTLIHEENHAVMGNSLENNMHDYYTSEELSLLKSEDATYKGSGFGYYVQSLEQECNNRAARFVMGYSENYVSDPAYGIFLDSLKKEYDSYSCLYDENHERSINSEKKQIDEAYNNSSIDSNEVFAAEIYLNENNRIKNEMSHIHTQIENEKWKSNDNMFNDLKEQCEFDSQNVFRTDRYENYFNEYFENKKSFTELLSRGGNDERSKEYYSLLNQKADIASMYKFNELKLSSAEANPELSQNCQRMIEYIKDNAGRDYSNMSQLDFDAFEGIDGDHGSFALGSMKLKDSGSPYFLNYSDVDGLINEENSIDDVTKGSDENIEDENAIELVKMNNPGDDPKGRYEEHNSEYIESSMYSGEILRDDTEDSEDLVKNDENSESEILKNKFQKINNYSKEEQYEDIEDSEEIGNETRESSFEKQDDDYEDSEGLVLNDLEVSNERVNMEMQHDLNGNKEENAEDLADDTDMNIEKSNGNNQLDKDHIDDSMPSDSKTNEENINNHRSGYFSKKDSESASDLLDNNFSNNQNNTLDNSVDKDGELKSVGEDSANKKILNSDDNYSIGETSNSPENHSSGESLSSKDTSANNSSENNENTYSR